ncbi:MAG: sigma-70 family RNA polymerase sigma factor [Planctomycetes bacterium]|nr:sigma-70 family RNA polymerase sigma factor [Planctomycetota bacterium]
MAVGLRLRKSTARGAAPPVIDLAAVDALLDVSVEQWDRRVAKSVRDLRGRGARIEIPDSPILANFASSQVTWGGLFEAQVKALPHLDRAAEFRMARRYEFLRARVRDALARAGHAESKLDQLVLRPLHALPAATRRTTQAATEHLARCVDEFERLRNLYVEGALYLIFSPVRRYRDLGVDEGDLLQEGAASLFQAIEGFDWRREVRFKTYAVYWIQQAILKTLYNASRTVRIPIWVQKTFRKIKRAQDRRRDETGAAPDLADVAQDLGLSTERIEEILAVRRYAVSLDAPIGTEDDGSSLAQSLADSSLEPIHESIREGDLDAELHTALAGLPDRERMILMRRYGLGGREPETLLQIAQDLGVTAERVRQLQKAAIERLRRPDAMERLKIFG